MLSAAKFSQVFALCACLLVSALLCGCGGGSSSTASNGPVTSATRTCNNLQFTLTVDKAVYTIGQKPQFTLTVKNIGTQPVTLDYPSSATYQFEVSQNGQAIDYEPQEALAVILSDSFAAGQTKVFTGSWNQTIESSGGAASAGQYTIMAWLPARGLNAAPISETDSHTLLAATPISITIRR